jgi:hypothetical protein
MCTTKKLANTNRNTNGKIMLLYYGEFYWQNSPSLYLSMNNKRNIILVYTKGITVRKERIKKSRNVQWHVIFTYKIIKEINPSINIFVILNLWPNKQPSSPIHPFLLLLPISVINKQHISYFIINQPSTTNPTTSTLSLSTSLFWFKFY